MFLQGLVLLVAGVSIVFLILGLLVVVVTFSSKFVTRFNDLLPDDGQKVKKTSKKTTCADDEIAVAIAAVLAHQGAR